MGKFRTTAFLLALSLSSVGMAQPQEAIEPQPTPRVVGCDQAYDSLPYGALPDLLDAQAPVDRRERALQAYLKLEGAKECPEYGYTVGLLYRFGPDMPGNLLPRDLDRARQLILAMAEAGHLQAYADLAEMEMVHGQYRESMKWTQVYLYYVKNIRMPQSSDGRMMQFDRSAYSGHLLNRAEVVWRWQKPVLPRRRVSEDLTAYLASTEERVAPLIGGRTRGGIDLGAAPRVVVEPGECLIRPLDRIGAATASYVLEVQPSGVVSRILVENFVPNMDAAELLKSCVRRYVFEPFDGQQPLLTRVTLTYGSSEGASFRR